MEKTKPDLMATTGAHQAAGSKRILAQLEHGVRPVAHPARTAGWTIDGWTISLFALLLLMCCVAWMMHDKTITPKTFRHGYSGSSSQIAARREVESAPAAEQPAAIVNEAAPENAGDAQTGNGPAPGALGGEPGAMHTAAQGTAPRTATGVATSAAPAMRSATTAAPAARAAAAAIPATRATAAAPVASPVGTSAATAANDTDVALLTALVAHANKPAAVTPERPRDVVERQDGDTTAQLLARCKQLGLIEGMLCRSRICSGRWEADAACRAPSH